MREAYNIGDTVKKTPEYAVKYSGIKSNEGVIVSVKMKLVSDDVLATSDRARYRARYTYQEKYPVFEMIINCNGTHYLVSQFGFNKDT